MSEPGAEMVEIVQAIDDVLADLPPAQTMTILDTLVGLVIARHGLPTEAVIATHGKNIPKFVAMFRGESSPEAVH